MHIEAEDYLFDACALACRHHQVLIASLHTDARAELRLGSNGLTVATAVDHFAKHPQVTRHVRLRRPISGGEGLQLKFCGQCGVCEMHYLFASRALNDAAGVALMQSFLCERHQCSN